MKFSLRTSLAGESQVALRHFGKSLPWGFGFYEKLQSATRWPQEQQSTPFRELNGYWASNSYVREQAWADWVFAPYKRIHNTLHRHYFEPHQLMRELQPQVAELYSALQIQGMEEYFRYLYPSQGMHPAEYNTRLLAFMLRPMLPVWNDYMVHASKGWGTMLKEFYAFKLLVNTPLMQSPVFLQMQQYVERQIPPMREDQRGTILGCVNAEDFPLWILSLVMVRRLAIAPVHPMHSDYSALAYVFKYIGQKVKASDNSFMGMVQPRHDALWAEVQEAKK